MADEKSLGIRVVSPAQFSPGTRQTPGSQRMAAITTELGVDSRMWAGTFLVEPGSSTGVHHHGDQETIAFVLEGEALVRWGTHGEHTATVRAGDFLHVPAWLVHQEKNPSAEEPFRWVVVRSSPEPVVINLPDSTWD